MISRIIRFIATDIWVLRLKNLPPLRAFLVRSLRLILFALRKFYTDGCPARASALTFYSLLSVVPVIAVLFAIGKGFGLDRMVETQIMKFAEMGTWPPEILNRIINFSQTQLGRARGGVIAGVGVLFLFWTVISILGNIEESLNHIWEVRKSRTLMRRFSDYLAIIVITPVLIVISSSITVVVASQVKLVAEKIALLGPLSSVILFGLTLLPYLSIWALLVLNYLVMPNTKVPVRSAILAGVLTGTLYQVVEWAYIKFQIGAVHYGAVYGSFAALPLFLIWLQLSWLIVLLGAEIAYAHEHLETFGFHPDDSRISLASKKLLVVRIFHLLVKNFQQGSDPLSATQISQRLEIPLRLTRQFLEELTCTGLAVQTVKGHKHESTFQPGRDIEHLTVQYALGAYEGEGTTPVPLPPSEEATRISALLKEIEEASKEGPGKTVLKEI
jgi:membrane protein